MRKTTIFQILSIILIILTTFEYFMKVSNYLYILSILIYILTYFLNYTFIKNIKLNNTESYIKLINENISNYSVCLDTITKVKDSNLQLIDYFKDDVKNKICINCTKNTICLTTRHKERKDFISKIYLNKDFTNNNFFRFCQNSETIRHYIAKIKSNNENNLINSINRNKQITYLTEIMNNIILNLNSSSITGLNILLKVKNYLISKYNIVNFNIDFCNNNSFECTFNKIRFNYTKAEYYIRKYFKIDISITKLNRTLYLLSPRINTKCTYGYSKISLKGNSYNGDNFNIYDRKSTFSVVLSDGMGSGFKAYKQSKELLYLIDELMKLNIPKDNLFSTLNTYFTTYTTLETFATLDFLHIDNIRQIAYFYKFGATNSLLMTNDGKLEVIKNNNLLLGIQEKITPISLKLNNIKFILLMSDGIFENIESFDDLENQLKLIKYKNEKKIAFETLNYINRKKNIKDDMSIVVINFEDN